MTTSRQPWSFVVNRDGVNTEIKDAEGNVIGSFKDSCDAQIVVEQMVEPESYSRLEAQLECISADYNIMKDEFVKAESKLRHIKEWIVLISRQLES